MRKSIWRRGVVRCGLFPLAMLCGPAYAQEPTAREKELMAIIESLEKRVAALEEKAANDEETRPAAENADEDVEAPAAGTAGAPLEFRSYWDDGLQFETPGGQAQLKIGGRIHNDWFWFDQDRSLQRMADQEDGTEFRRARLYLSGAVYENLQFKFQYDFAGGDADFEDVYLELNQLPAVHNLRIGQFKEPFSLEELTSSNNVTFMERALPNTFAPGRGTGAMIHRAFLGAPGAQRLTAAAGIFRPTDDFGNDSDDGGYAGTARITGLPWYRDGGRKLLHLGASYTHRNVDENLRIRQRPEAHGSDRFVDTGDFDVDTVDSYVLEGALVHGPFSLQSEYFASAVDTELRGDRDFDGFYVQASYLLTGEHRPYEHADGAFGGVVPRENFIWFGADRGWGAWELALRYSSIDLHDGRNDFLERIARVNRAVRGGEEDNFTVGLNWYLNPNARIMWNYVHAELDSDVYDGDLGIFQTRFQLAF